eukprot:scaffold49383_cov27-Tisochrysis_lutea.AAC.9
MPSTASCAPYLLANGSSIIDSASRMAACAPRRTVRSSSTRRRPSHSSAPPVALTTAKRRVGSPQAQRTPSMRASPSRSRRCTASSKEAAWVCMCSTSASCDSTSRSTRSDTRKKRGKAARLRSR